MCQLSSSRLSAMAGAQMLSFAEELDQEFEQLQDGRRSTEIRDIREMFSELRLWQETMCARIRSMEETLVRLQANIQQRMEQHTDPKDQADKMDATREVQIFPHGDKYHKIAMACPSARKASSSYEARVVKDLQVSEAFAKTLGKKPCAVCFPGLQ